MKIPSKKECYRIICDSHMMEHIVAHSFQVCRVALVITDHMRMQYSALNRLLVETSAILHDITKTRSFRTKENHDRTGAQFLTDLGYPEVGDIVRQHVVLDTYISSSPPTEVEIVNYSDKRVLHDKVVSLEERKTYIIERYGTQPANRKRIRDLWQKTEKLEKKLFDHLPFAPEELEIYLNATENLFSEFLSFRSIHQADTASQR